MNVRSRIRWGSVIVALFVTQSLLAQGNGWKPERSVDILTGTAAGGALDRNARTIQRIWQAHKIVDASVNVVNKVGGGGAVSWAYMNQHPGDGHMLSIASVVLVTNRITGANPLSHLDVTPIAHLMHEYVAVAVKADSSIKNGHDLIERLRKNPDAVRVGIGTSLGGPSHTGLGLILKAAGIDVKKLKIAVFKSGGAATTAVMGGHVDVVASSAINYVRQVEAGQVRSLGVAAPQRLGGVFANVPTWREQGVDAVFSNWRAFVGPKGMTPAQVAYWEEATRRATETEEWKQELARNLSVAAFMPSRETAAQFEAQDRELRAILAALGMSR